MAKSKPDPSAPPAWEDTVPIENQGAAPATEQSRVATKSTALSDSGAEQTRHQKQVAVGLVGLALVLAVSYLLFRTARRHPEKTHRAAIGILSTWALAMLVMSFTEDRYSYEIREMWAVGLMPLIGYYGAARWVRWFRSPIETPHPK